MNKNELKILDKIKSAITQVKLDDSVIYLCPETFQPGSYLFGETELIVPWIGNVIFIDLEPKANWGHKCIYLVIQKDGNGIFQKEERSSPFLSSCPYRFNFFSKGTNAPDWTVNY